MFVLRPVIQRPYGVVDGGVSFTQRLYQLPVLAYLAGLLVIQVLPTANRVIPDFYFTPLIICDHVRIFARR